jgi:hypothetical protein
MRCIFFQLPRYLSFAGIVLLTNIADACVLCHSPVAEQVRAGTFNSSFGLRLSVIAAPFPIFLAIVALIYFGLPASKRTGTKDEHAS